MDELSRYFDALEVRRGASLEEIKRAYRDLVQVWHPDRYAHNPRLRAKAEEKLKNLNEAYQRISAYTERSNANTPPPPKSAPPPPTNNTSTAQSARTEPRETKPPPNSSPPPPPRPPPSSANPTTPPASAAKTSGNDGCIVAVIVVLGIIILFAVSQQGSETHSTPVRAASQPSQLPPTTTTDLQGLPALKAQIAERIARKDAEFDRLQRWYQQGVSASDESGYRASLDRAQQEEQDIAALILAYNAKKKDAASVASAAPEVRTYTPQRGGILFDLYPGDAGPGKLTVHNGTDHHAICKLIDTSTNAKVCSFIILANTKDGISGVTDGTFRVIFAYGDAIIEGTDRFASPNGFSEFREPFDFVTTRTTSGYQYSTFNITLHKVAGGNARTGTISANEYNKY